MPRVKGGVHALKNRRNTLRKVKGYRFGRSKKERAANEAIVHAGKYAFAHRRTKKNDFRRLWNIKIGAELKGRGISYSKFIHALKLKKIMLDRKILAHLAEHNTATFDRLLHKAAAK
jgi:large subunit ribosomal protein L20